VCMNESKAERAGAFTNIYSKRSNQNLLDRRCPCSNTITSTAPLKTGFICRPPGHELVHLLSTLS